MSTGPGEKAAPGTEQTFTDAEQTLADTDQTLSDTDQTGADLDQTGSERDQVAADRDQAASDRDLASGVNRQDHELTRDMRQRSAHQREETAVARLDTASQRDASARTRDEVAIARDLAAAARDHAVAQRDVAFERALNDGVSTGAEVVLRAAELRRRAARQRVSAAEQRAGAAEDREAAARDREQAARDRLQALADREALAQQIALAETDQLTGARTRTAGLVDLEHELDRSRRTNRTLVVAYIDVVGLKTLNDTAGHAAGDTLLKSVVGLIQSHMRSYDFAIRLGGDEFLCVMSDISLGDARERFSEIAGALAASPQAAAIRVGLAELQPDETGESLIGRADMELLERRH